MKLKNAAFVCAVMVAGAWSPATADDIATSTIAQAGAPATITRCFVTYAYGFQSSFNLYNRTSHSLIDASIEYRFYDRDNTQIGRTAYTYTPGETISPQDTGTFNNNSIYVSLQEPVSAVSRVTCRLSGAHFTGRLAWKSGSPWQGGALSPNPKSEAARDDAPLGGTGQAAATRSAHRTTTGFKFDVEKAWNDVVRDGIFVHDALIVHGGDNGVTVRPSDFVLTMALANGAQKTYPGMTTAAPTYQKYNPLTKDYTTAYQIDPKTDLGRLGSIIVPAHSDVSVTVTFTVSDQIADASANRQVGLR
jgi:hypothetical protein